MLKRTTEEVAKHFEQHGCELLGEYTGALAPIAYRCKCGTVSKISWNNFTKGHRCGFCVKQSPKKKRSLKEVQSIFVERGCEFLDTEFKGIHFKHRYRCKCGKESEITFAGFYHQNQNCKECGLDKCKGEFHHSWHKDRKAYKKDRLFATRCRTMVRRVFKAMNKKKVGRTSDILGYDTKTLRTHLEAHPNWKSIQGDDWQIDHVFPVTAFIEHGVYDVTLINCLDNLQPMSSLGNLSKGNKYDKDAFNAWLITRRER